MNTDEPNQNETLFDFFDFPDNQLGLPPDVLNRYDHFSAESPTLDLPPEPPELIQPPPPESVDIESEIKTVKQLMFKSEIALKQFKTKIENFIQYFTDLRDYLEFLQI